MNDPVLYDKSNSFQKRNTIKALNKFAHLLQWSENGFDSILDVGCGTGNVTIEIIVPLLPTNFRLIGCDISSDMIEFARKHSPYPNVSYEQLDIAGNVDKFVKKFGPFDHVISTFCLHWVQDQYAAMNNIYKLLIPDGDCLLIYVVWCPFYTVYVEMSQSSKWSKYMKDCRQFIPPHCDSINPVDDLRPILKSVGFAAFDVQLLENAYLFESPDAYVNFLRSIDPFVKGIPKDEQHEYAVELTRRTMARNEKLSGLELLNGIHLLIVHAKK